MWFSSRPFIKKKMKTNWQQVSIQVFIPQMAINFQERTLLSSLSMNIQDMAMKTSGKLGAYCFGGLNISIYRLCQTILHCLLIPLLFVYFQSSYSYSLHTMPQHESFMYADLPSLFPHHVKQHNQMIS